MPPKSVPSRSGVDVTEDYRAPERYTLHVCADCKQPAHNGDRCPRDHRRIWTQMEGVEYVRADLQQGAVDDREHLIALLHRIDHRLAADPQACGMCAKVRAALPSGGNDAA